MSDRDPTPAQQALSEVEQWEAWQRGEARCPYCIGLDDRDFAATCDCSRYSLETTGQPIVIQVIGRPDTAQVVPPERIVDLPPSGPSGTVGA